MNTQVLVALIGAGGAIAAAVIAAVLARRAKPSAAMAKPTLAEPTDEKKLGLTFADISLAPTSRYWTEGSRDWEGKTALSEAERSARWYFRRTTFDEGTDLPLEATVINNGADPVIISRVGVEIVANMNAWYTGRYYGYAPKAQAIDISGAYELSIPASTKIQAFMDEDPDEWTWCDVGEVYGVSLADPMYLERGVPFRYTLNLKQYDLNMATHTILRLWLRTSVGEIRSDDISVIFGR